MEAETTFMVTFLTLVGIGIGLLAFGIIKKEKEPIIWGSGLSMVYLTFSIILAQEWNSKVAKHAGEFFATRDDAYACKDLNQIECDYTKKLWVRDSIEWAERVKVIMEK